MNLKTTLIFISLLMLVSTASAGVVMGTTKSVSGANLRSVTITACDDTQTISDSAGSYSMSVTPLHVPSYCKITASKAGYYDETKSVYISDQGSWGLPEFDTANFVMSPINLGGIFPQVTINPIITPNF